MEAKMTTTQNPFTGGLAVINNATPNAPDGLESTMLALAKFGRPTLGIYGSRGWNCSVDMHVAAVGVKFDVSSGHQNPDPLTAATKCLELVHAAIKARN